MAPRDDMLVVNPGAANNHDAQDHPSTDSHQHHATRTGPVALAIRAEEADVTITVDPDVMTALIHVTGQDETDEGPTWTARETSTGRPALEVRLSGRPLTSTADRVNLAGATITGSSVGLGRGVVINGVPIHAQAFAPSRRVEAFIPPGSTVVVETSSGDITLIGTDPDGVPDLTATSVSGDIEVAVAAREAQVRTTSGDINLAQVLAGLNAVSVSGDVTVADLNAGGGHVQSVSGDVRVRFGAQAHGAPVISTVSGGVRVSGAVPAQVHLSSVSGRVREH